MLEKERVDWRKKKGCRQVERISWGQVFRDAPREQLERRELEVDCNLVAAGVQLRRRYYSEDETYYMDHEVQF